MGKKEKAPCLRFKDTNGKDYPAWEQRELKDVAEIVGGGTPSTSVPAYWNGSIDWYSPTEIGQENFAKGSKRKISNEGLNNSSAKLLPAHKTILFTSRATIGEAAILEREGATNQGFQSIVTKEGVDVYFLYSYKHHLKKQALIKASGSTFLEISKNEVEGLHVPVPSGEEQAKIGSFFKLVDKAITLHQRKLETLKKLKRTLLQKMFPKKGQLKPELRFPGFTNDWEQHKLGDLGHTYGGLSGKSKQDFGHGDARFVTYMNVFSNPIGDPCMVDSIEIDDRQSRVRKGDVLFTTSSETPDEVGMSCVWPSDSENLYLNSFCFGYRPTTKINSNFLASLLRSPSVREKIIFLAQGISRYNISKNKVMEISIPLPSEEEQSQIGDFFTQLDKTITLHQRKLETYKKLKKSLLQKMFI